MPALQEDSDTPKPHILNNLRRYLLPRLVQTWLPQPPPRPAVATSAATCAAICRNGP
jgi:hypothetical protein